MLKKVSLLAAAALALSGCNSFSGRVAGKELAVQDALFFNYQENNITIGATVILADKPRLCDSLKANRVPRNANFVALTLFRVTTTGVVPPDQGDYTVTGSQITGPGNYANAWFNALDANCYSTLPDTAAEGMSGIVKVANYRPSEGGGISGTFDITFGSQADKTTGGFNAQWCNLSTNYPTQPSCE